MQHFIFNSKRVIFFLASNSAMPYTLWKKRLTKQGQTFSRSGQRRNPQNVERLHSSYRMNPTFCDGSEATAHSKGKPSEKRTYHSDIVCGMQCSFPNQRRMVHYWTDHFIGTPKFGIILTRAMLTSGALRQTSYKCCLKFNLTLIITH